MCCIGNRKKGEILISATLTTISDSIAPFLELLKFKRKRDEILAMFFKLTKFQLVLCPIISSRNLQNHLTIIMQATF